MSWQYSPYFVVLLAASLVLFTLSLYALLRIATHGMRPTFAILAIWNAGAAFWALSYGFQISNSDVAGKLLWFVIGSPAPFIVSIGWFVIVAYAVDRTEWVAPRRFGPIAGLGVAAIALHVVSLAVPLLWTDADPEVVNELVVLDLAFTPLYHVLAIGYPVAVAVGGLVLFAAELRSSDAVDLIQAVSLGGAVLLPILTTVAVLSGVWDSFPFDLTPVALVGTGAMLSYAVYRSEVFGTVPIAMTTLFETMAEGVLVLGADDRVTHANESARALLDQDPVQGEDASTVLPGLGGRLDHYDLDDEFRYTITTEREDGGEQYLRVHCSPVGSERTTGRLALIEDVTEQRRVEQRYQALIEGISDVITLLDDDGMVTYVSGSVSRILGRSPATAIASDGVDFLVQDGGETANASLERAIETPGATTRFEHVMTADDGEEHVFEAVARNMTDDPNVEGIVVVSRDITARKERERELAAMNERLERFAGVLSHDLRNPLEVAEIHLTLAQRGNEDALETVSAAHDRIDEMIDDVLTLVRDAGDVTPEQVALEDLAEEAWSTVATDDATLALADPPAIMADRPRTVQVFENLYRNALEHADTDGDSLTVTVGALPDGFYVEDDGPGIPPEDRETVFEHGYTTGEDGTGLGLAIVRQVAEDHGWTVSAAAGADGGARFAFRNVALASTAAGRSTDSDGEGNANENGSVAGGAADGADGDEHVDDGVADATDDDVNDGRSDADDADDGTGDAADDGTADDADDQGNHDQPGESDTDGDDQATSTTGEPTPAGDGDGDEPPPGSGTEARR